MQRFIGTLLIAVLFGIAFVWLGCGGTAKTATSVEASAAVPEWFANVPADPQHLYAARTARSADMQMALDMAKHSARVEIARQVLAKIEQSRASSETLSAVILKNSRVTKQKVEREGKFYQIYVLMKMPFDEANIVLAAKTGASEADIDKRWLKALENEIKKREKLKREHKQ